jgi:hypothetical protein
MSFRFKKQECLFMLMYDKFSGNKSINTYKIEKYKPFR